MMKSFKRLVPCLSILALSFVSCSSMLLDSSEIEANDQEFFEYDEGGSSANAYYSNNRGIRTYSVTWKKPNGDILKIDSDVQEGTTPVFGGDASYNDGSFSYELFGWSPTPSPVYSNAFYTAIYSISCADYYLFPDEENNGYCVNGIKNISETVTIPQSFNGKPITSICFNSSLPWDGVKKLVLPDSIIKITGNTYVLPFEEVVFGNNITNISKALFKNSTALKTIHLGESITSIPNDMFFNCSNLSNVIFNGDVESIGERAFYGCSSLKEFNAPTSLASIGKSAFSYSGIEEVSLPLAMDLIGEGAFNYCNSLVNITLPEYVGSLNNYVLSNCQALESVSLPKNINEISQGLFMNSTKLNNVEIPEGVTKINKNAFYSCKGLTNVSFPCTLETIASGSFNSCGFTSLVFPQGLKNIEENAFTYCSDLVSISLPSSINNIGKNAFSLTSLMVANYEGNVIQYNAININSSNYDLSSTPKKYNSYNEEQALNDDEFLVVYLDSNNNILEAQKHTGDESYEYTGELPTKTGDTSNEFVFSRWNLVKSTNKGCRQYVPEFMTIKNKFKLTFDYKNGKTVDFYLSENQTISYPALPENDSNIFIGWDKDYDKMPATNVTFNAQYVSRTTPGLVYSIATNKVGFKNWNQVLNENIVTVSNTAITSAKKTDGAGVEVLILPNTIKTIDRLAFSYAGQYKEIVLQEGLTTIKEQAFQGCQAKKINIPSTVTQIEQSAFGASLITNATLPYGITSIADGTFGSCTSLASVTLPNTIKTIEYGAFNSCISLSNITIPSSVKTIGDFAFNYTGLSSVVISEGTTTIGNRSFCNIKSLKTLTLPSSLTSIGFEAFRECTNLSTINYKGSKTQFDSYKLDSNTQACFANATINYNC